MRTTKIVAGLTTAALATAAREVLSRVSGGAS